ncbi:MAG: Xaa-Pro dipeptidase [Pseudomonadota bacterium]
MTASHYAAHVASVRAQYDQLLDDADATAAIVPAGQLRFAYQDDRDYVFAANPNFKHWVPLTHHPKCVVIYRPGNTPVLGYFQEADYWHLPAGDPDGDWTAAFDVRICRNDDELTALVAEFSDGALLIGEQRDADALRVDRVADEMFFKALHETRTRKSDYELDCLRAAQRLAVRGHQAAARAFAAGASEYAIHMQYLTAMDQRESELPYNSIVALNEHAAVLHYQYLDRHAPDESRAFLIDAGAQVASYAADITRTYSNGNSLFTALLDAMDTSQQAICGDVRAGVDYRSLHLSAHRRLAEVLIELKLATPGVSAEALVEERITWAFFPHGLGHFLGLQVHDVGGLTSASSYDLIAKPEGHESLRLTRKLEENQVLTIEPGCYFIPLLLDPIRTDAKRKHLVNWDAVDALIPYGGVRIEDNVRILADGCENLTRDAFATLD